MANLIIANGNIPASAPHAPPPGLEPANLAIRQGRIHRVGPAAPAPDTGLPQLDAEGCTVLPGFIDLHVHGAAGHDTMDASPIALAEMARFFALHGVTDFLATTMTAPPAPTLAAVQAVAATDPTPMDGARLLGIHLEGPFISPRFPGAQLADAIRRPDRREFADLVAAGPVRMITLAPEEPGASALIRDAVGRGVVAVLGHTNADYDQCQAAFAAGVSQATHTYNAMTGLHHRRPGTLGAVLTADTVYAQLIADNIHVHPAAMNVLYRCKGVDRTVLITDAMRAAGLPPGRYELGGQPVTVADGSCRLDDGTLAGSILTMDRALTNFMAATGLSLTQAWPASSRSAAAALGMADTLGAIEPGYTANLVLLDAALEVVATVVTGRVVYLRDTERLRAR